MELIREIIYPNDLKDIQDIFKDNRVNLRDFKFDRDEANNYDKIERLSTSLDSLKIDLSNFKFDRDEANDYKD
jgi:hypothetical protein